MVSGSQDTCLKMWQLNAEALEGKKSDCRSLTVVHTAVAHDKDINSVCVSPNDKLIATGSQDKSAKVKILQYVKKKKINFFIFLIKSFFFKQIKLLLKTN